MGRSAPGYNEYARNHRKDGGNPEWHESFEEAHPEELDRHKEHYAYKDPVEGVRDDGKEMPPLAPFPGHGRYPFTAPKVRPMTMYLCTRARKTSAGRSETTEMAAISPQLVPVTVTYSASPVVTVRA